MVVLYQFGEYEIDTSSFELRRAGEAVAVEPRVLSLLILLAENQDRLVSKEEIVDKIWNGRAISDAAVSTSIRDARKAVGDSGASQSVIKTVHGLGFRFNTHVVETKSTPQEPGQQDADQPAQLSHGPKGGCSFLYHTRRRDNCCGVDWQRPARCESFRNG